eukprot:m.5207 g.5207  ORF g.5207 m.5207 type:complete len:527 (+) comp4160_c0_seq1:23-1603(+)
MLLRSHCSRLSSSLSSKRALQCLSSAPIASHCNLFTSYRCSVGLLEIGSQSEGDIFLRRHLTTNTSSTTSLSAKTQTQSKTQTDTAVPSFFNFYDRTIVTTAGKKIPRLTASDLLVLGSVSNPIEKSTDILNQQLPPFVAKVLMLFHKLPFIVGCNPHLKKVHTMYATAFKSFFRFAQQHKTTKKKDEFVKSYTAFLETLLEPNIEVLSLVARGLSESVNMRHIQVEQANSFMKELIQSRIHIRFLMENHMELLHQQEHHVGGIHTQLNPTEVAKHCVAEASEAVQRRYGKAPYVLFDGDTNFRITFVEQHLHFILSELLKNAMSATVKRYGGGVLPPIRLTFAHEDTYFVVRISDQGVSFNPKNMHDIMRYSFERGVDNVVSVPKGDDASDREQDLKNKFSQETNTAAETNAPSSTSSSSPSSSPSSSSSSKGDMYTDTSKRKMTNVDVEFASHSVLGLGSEGAEGSEDERLLHQVGVGLPLSHAYARYFNGDLLLVPLPGLGVDAFVTMYCLASQTDTVIESQL